MSKYAVINLKTDPELKKQAVETASRLGISLSAVLNNELRRFAVEQSVVFDTPVVPNERTARQLAEIEADVKAGRRLSGPFTDFDELEHHLNSLGHAD